MTVSCTFELNRKETSRFVCSGFGAVEAYSGQRAGRDNPDNVADVDVGPIPPGTYYLIDRQSGGRIGGLRDFIGEHFGSSDRHKWFTLWNPHGGDVTMIQGIRRGQFRLHPEGSRHLSQGCITVKDLAGFERLQRYIRRTSPTLPIPGTNMRAYGRVEVR
ncbi:DUF2778 domain-containing protein [Paraburkholderia sp. 32]|uniref:DUF2778 domain-containing protein n=1 Tax=unclassified Paraburkholderia TaxID=2615204 RepID=UPI003D232BEE